MARRRLTPLGLDTDAEERSHNLAPVARVAADAAAQAALDDLAEEMRRNRESGRLVVELPLDCIDAAHLSRDRLHLDPEDMASLKASLAARGQQTPIEVVALSGDRYGLISGARRLTALRELAAERGIKGTALALVRRYDEAPGAYLAMVEENEIRADLSFYERGRLAAEAARLGVFPTAAAAVKALFVHAAPAKRSKILSFVALHEALGDTLRFPEAIPEKLGLALVKRLEQDGERDGLRAKLAEAAPATGAQERRILEAALQNGSVQGTAVELQGDSIRVSGGAGRVVLTGPGVTEALLAELREWVRAR